MQNKGFVKVFALLLTLVCVFYLSFSFVTRLRIRRVQHTILILYRMKRFGWAAIR